MSLGWSHHHQNSSLCLSHYLAVSAIVIFHTISRLCVYSPITHNRKPKKKDVQTTTLCFQHRQQQRARTRARRAPRRRSSSSSSRSPSCAARLRSTSLTRSWRCTAPRPTPARRARCAPRCSFGATGILRPVVVLSDNDVSHMNSR